MRAKDLIQMFLLGAVIVALAGFPKAKKIAIKMKAGVRLRDGDGRVVNTKKKLICFLLPARIAFARWEANHFEGVPVRVLKIERLDTRCAYVPIRQPLRTCGHELDFKRTQFFEGTIHVAHDDRDVLEPQVVASGVLRNRLPSRCEIFSQLQELITQLHPHDPCPRTKDANQMLVFITEDLHVGNFLKRER